MVLTFHMPRLAHISGAIRWIPTIATWVLLLAVVLLLGWVYVANSQPSPYGMCYESRGRPIPCELVKKR